MKKQIREIPIAVASLHVREAEGEEQSREIEGRAVVFGVRSGNLTPWSSKREVYEIMEPGCIDQALIDSSDVLLTAYHDNEMLLGRSINGKGTLSLMLDAEGMMIRCTLPNTTAGNDILELIRRGDLTGMSFAYSCNEEDSENGVSYELTNETGEDGKEVWLRHVKKCNGLYDVTVARFPAYSETSVKNRELDVVESAIDAVQRENDEADRAAEQARIEKEREQRKRDIESMRREIEIMENFQ